MKKKILLLPLLMLLSACGTTESSSPEISDSTPSTTEKPTTGETATTPETTETPSTSDSETTPETGAKGLDNMLATLKEGFAAENRLLNVQDYGINSSGERSYTYVTYCKDIETSGDFTYSKKYSSNYISAEDYESGNITYVHDEESLETSYIFTKTPNKDTLSTAYLGFDNEMHYEEIVNDFSGLTYNYGDTFENPFLHLSSEYFTKVSDTEYKLIEDDYHLDRLYTALAHYVYGEICSYKVDSFSLITNGEIITGYKGAFEPLSYTSFILTENITFEASFTDQGRDSYVIPEPMDTEEIPALEEAFASLKNNNFEVTMTTESEGWSGTTKTISTATSNGTEVIRKDYASNKEATAENQTREYYFKGYQKDYYGTPKDYTLKSVKLNGEYFYSTTPVQANIATQMFPKFNLSSKLFEASPEAGIYTLRLDVPYYFVFGTTNNFSLLGNNAMSDLKIKLTDDTITFETAPVQYGSKETVVYSNIGKVGETLVEANKVHETSDGFLTSIVDYCSTEAEKTELQNRFGSDLLALVPVPGGINNEMSTYFGTKSDTEVKGQLKFLLDVNDPSLNSDDLFVKYAAELSKNGFTYDPANTNGYFFEKTVKYNGKDCTFNVSFGLSGSTIFVVDLLLTIPA